MDMKKQMWIGWISAIVAIIAGLWIVYPSWFVGWSGLAWVIGGLNILFGLFWIAMMVKGK